MNVSQILKWKWTLELLWWLFTAIIITLVMLPIYFNVPAFPFWKENTLMIILFITFSRYFFLLPLTFIARMKWIKVAIIAVTVLFVGIMSTTISDIRNFMDEQGLQTLVDHLHVTRQTSMMRYIKNELVFFGVGSIITGILLAMRMIVSLWRMRNSGRV